jgi:SAM-dependent methyltransferase
MFEAEARWLRRALDAFPPDRLSPVLNLGSSSAVVRSTVQPWIDAELFHPLSRRGVATFHVDMRQLPGVDIRADLADEVDIRRLCALSPNALLCCNLLEHVLEPGRLALHCLDLLRPGGLLFVTVPYSYPYHRDPIDTMYRPSPAELSELFAGARLLDSIIRGARAPMDTVTPFFPLSGAVPVLRKMEAVDGAPLLARCRIPNHLRRLREAIGPDRLGRRVTTA